MKQTLLVAALAALAAPSLLADEIQLTNGRKINGVVSKETRTPGKLVVEVGAGTIVLDEKDVSSIKPSPSPLNEYLEKYAAIKDSKKASDFVELSTWAKANGLTRYVTPLSLRAIELDPENAQARADLRYEKIGGKWLTFEQAQLSRGFVYRDDRWMTQAEIELQEKRRIEAQERAAIAKAQREERRQEDLARRQAAFEEYNRQQEQAMSSLDGYFYSPSFAFTTPYYRPYWWAPYVRSRNVYQHGWQYDGWGGLPLLGRWR